MRKYILYIVFISLYSSVNAGMVVCAGNINNSGVGLQSTFTEQVYHSAVQVVVDDQMQYSVAGKMDKKPRKRDAKLKRKEKRRRQPDREQKNDRREKRTMEKGKSKVDKDKPKETSQDRTNHQKEKKGQSKGIRKSKRKGIILPKKDMTMI